MKRLQARAVRAGLVLTKDFEGFYHLYDVKMEYDILITKIKASVERTITDELSMIEYNKKNTPAIVGG